MATDNMTVYSALMNRLHQLVQFHQSDSLADTLVDLNSEKVIEKEATVENKIKYQAEKMGNK